LGTALQAAEEGFEREVDHRLGVALGDECERSRNRQLREPVDAGPEHPRDPQAIPGSDHPGGLPFIDARQQLRERLRTQRGNLRVLRAAREHHPKCGSVVEGELNVGSACGPQPLLRVRVLRGGPAIRIAVRRETLRGDRVENGVAVPKVPIGRRVGDSGPPGHFAQREGFGPPLFDQLSGGPQQLLAQVSVMVSALGRRC
jgi:hypothetical protein